MHDKWIMHRFLLFFALFILRSLLWLQPVLHLPWQHIQFLSVCVVRQDTDKCCDGVYFFFFSRFISSPNGTNDEWSRSGWQKSTGAERREYECSKNKTRNYSYLIRRSIETRTCMGSWLLSYCSDRRGGTAWHQFPYCDAVIMYYFCRTMCSNHLWQFRRPWMRKCSRLPLSVESDK